MSIVPNVTPRAFTLSAFAVGFLLIDELSGYEQNALGSWFMLVGQTLCTNSSHHMLRKERNGDLPSTDGVDLLKKANNAINKGINNYGK